MPETCTHCGKPIQTGPEGSGYYSHNHINRCQSPDVPYGHEAHPASVPCPEWCIGHSETPCTHHADNER